MFGLAIEEIQFDRSSEFRTSDARVDCVFGSEVVEPAPGGNIWGVKGMIGQGSAQLFVSSESVDSECSRTGSGWSREEAEIGIRYSKAGDLAKRGEGVVRRPE